MLVKTRGLDVFTSLHFTINYHDDTCCNVRLVSMLQSLLVDLDVPTREKVDDARRNLRVLGPRTDVDIQPRTLLICI